MLAAPDAALQCDPADCALWRQDLASAGLCPAGAAAAAAAELCAGERSALIQWHAAARPCPAVPACVDRLQPAPSAVSPGCLAACTAASGWRCAPAAAPCASCEGTRRLSRGTSAGLPASALSGRVLHSALQASGKCFRCTTCSFNVQVSGQLAPGLAALLQMLQTLH